MAEVGNPANVKLTSPVSAWNSDAVTFGASTAPDEGTRVSYLKFFVNLPATERTSLDPNPYYRCGEPPGDPSCEFVAFDAEPPYFRGGVVTGGFGFRIATVQAWRYEWGDARPVFLGQSSSTFQRTPPGPATPTRAAFYQAQFPESWTRPGAQTPATPFTKWTPAHGQYDSGDPDLVRAHTDDMRYAKIGAAITSWWGCSRGPGDDGSQCPAGATTDASHGEASRLPVLLDGSVTEEGTADFHWALYYEPERTRDPTVEQLKADLRYIAETYASHPSYWREVDHRPVVFVRNGDDLTTGKGCNTVSRWVQATDQLVAEGYPDFWIVLKTFSGFNSCAPQRLQMPEAWHQYEPTIAYQASAVSPTTPGVFGSVSISPGFDRADDVSPTRVFRRRDLHRWKKSVRDMIAAKTRYQLITTFNGWSDGTAVEPAHEWTSSIRPGQTRSFGQFLDVLRDGGGIAADPVIAAAGDISPANVTCSPTASSCHDGPVSDTIIDAIRPDLVLTLGDNQYETGQLDAFNAGYQASWGRFRSYTLPTAGNHERNDANGPYEGHFDYFNNGGFVTPQVATGMAGERGKGYYSYDVGAWHLLALNSDVGGAAFTSQMAWLRADLAAQPESKCMMAFFHQPLFTDGPHAPNEGGRTDDLWNVLYPEGVDVVLNGHDHNYQRFAHKNPAGVDDPTGIHPFVVGTGGKGLTSPISRNDALIKSGDTHGVLKMTLHSGSYDYEFVRDTYSNNGTFADAAGAVDCANDGHAAAVTTTSSLTATPTAPRKAKTAGATSRAAHH